MAGMHPKKQHLPCLSQQRDRRAGEAEQAMIVLKYNNWG